LNPWCKTPRPAAGRGERPDPPAAEAEVARQMQICNACRYCEGFCAVFPAMTRRLEFGPADVHYLANLCHNCGACLHACQYAPPHEFAVNVPQAMARVRARPTSDYAWPQPLGALYRRNGLTLSLALAAGLALFLVLALALNGTLWGGRPGGNFYAFPAQPAGGDVRAGVRLCGAGAGHRRHRASGGVARHRALPVAANAAEAAHDALTLKYLDGGHGEGCNNEDDAFTPARRRCHHFTFYGFMLCFAPPAWPRCTTTLWLGGALRLPSLPKLLGTVGGVLLMRARWACSAEPAPPPAARRCGAEAHGPGLHRLLFGTA
jgi:citrate/tricarballylate utilization protein